MMSLKVLHAGDGYAYLTRQVATGDNPRTRGELMADYYTAHGAPAGQWWGRGAAELGVEGEVTEEQMQAAYGQFLHPDANETLKKLVVGGMSVEDAVDAVRLGRKPFDFNKDNAFLVAVKEQMITFTQANKKVPSREEQEALERLVARRMLAEFDAEVTDSERAVETSTSLKHASLSAQDAAGFVPECLNSEVLSVPVAPPITEDRVTAFIAQSKREARFPVAGYDMVFTPAKSISVLWGIGDETTRKAIMKAHSEAVESSLHWIEDNAVFTRSGTDGVEKIDCDGSTVAKFVHFDNRSGDPNLHTHCAMLNRVHCADGKYRTIDGTVLHRATVTASEHYNQRVTELVERYLGVEFEAVTKSRGGRPVWEVKGIPTELMDAMSRRDEVLERGRELIAEYRKTYGRTPPKSVQYKLMEQANLETRSAKGEARSLEEMVTAWREIANSTSTDFSVESVLADVFSPTGTDLDEPASGASDKVAEAGMKQEPTRRVPYSPDKADAVVEDVMDVLSRSRATWTRFHVDAEITRQIGRFTFESDEHKHAAIEEITTGCVVGECVAVEHDQVLPGVDADSSSKRLFRANGESIFTPHASKRYTSKAVLEAEKTVTEASQMWVVNTHTTEQARKAATEFEATRGFELSADKASFVEHLLCSPAVLAAGIGPAGSGKTTAMEVFSRAWEKTGNKVIGLAPSAVAAGVLGEDTGIATGTIAQFLHPESNNSKHGLDVGPGDVIVVDEAGMASTRDLADVVNVARDAGAFVRLVGDPKQLDAIESGGMLAEVAATTDAPVLTEVNRFADPGEAEVSLKLRDGDSSVIDWYVAHGRVASGLREELPGRVLSAWWEAIKEGSSAVMIAGDRHTVDTLNEMARASYIDTGEVTPGAGEVTISGGRLAAVGDVIVTRENDSTLRYGKGKAKRVRNGDLWTIAATTDGGGVVVTHRDTGETVSLPGDYVTENVELGYASTIYRSQGITVDKAFVIPSASLDRQGLYVALSRGRKLNKIFLPDDQVPDVDSHIAQGQSMSPREVFASIMGRDGSAVTAHAALEAADAQALDVPTVVAAYTELVEGLATSVVLAAAGEDDNARTLLREDGQTSRLTEHVGRLDATGADTDTIFSEAIRLAKTRWDATPEDERGSFAFLVRMAVEDTHAYQQLPEDDLVWSVGAPMPPARESEHRRMVLADGDLHEFVQSTYEVIQEHLEAAGDEAVSQVPEWTKQVGEHHPAQGEYHAAWCKAVRGFAASAVMDPGVVTAQRIKDTDGLDDRLVRLLASVRAAKRKPTTSTIYDDLLPGEARAYVVKCRENVEVLRQRRGLIEKDLGKARSYPSVAKVVAAQEEVTAQAELIAQAKELRTQLNEAKKMLVENNLDLGKAQNSGVFGRSKRVEAAWEAQQRTRRAVDQIHPALSAVEDKLPGEGAWDRIVAKASNTAQAERERDQARVADEKKAATATAKLNRIDNRIVLWEERAEITEGLLEAHKPATHEQREKHMETIYKALKKNRATRTTEKASPEVKQGQPVGGESLASLREQFNHVARIVRQEGSTKYEVVNLAGIAPDNGAAQVPEGMFLSSIQETLAYQQRRLDQGLNNKPGGGFTPGTPPPDLGPRPDTGPGL